MTTQLKALLAELRAECERDGHKMQSRGVWSSFDVRRCVACGNVESVVYARNPLARMQAWLAVKSMESEPWTCEPGYAGPLQPDVRVRLINESELLTLYLMPLTWRIQSDGRFTEFGRLGGDVFRIVWRDYISRRTALIGGWPTYKQRAVATIRLRIAEPVEVDGHSVHGDITVVRVTDLTLLSA